MILIKKTYISLILLMCAWGLTIAQQRNANDVIIYPLPSEEIDRSGDMSGVPISPNAWKTGDKLVCVWEGAELRIAPGEKSGSMGKLRFGEDVLLLGQRATVISEGNRNYLKVSVLGSSEEGWIKESLLSEGGLVIVLRIVPYYSTKSRAEFAKEGNEFFPGEMAILTDFDSNGEWLKLKGRGDSQNIAKEGWIKNFDNVSVRDNDLAIASRIYEIQQTKDRKLQRDALVGIRRMPEFNESGMELAVDYAIQRTHYASGIGNTKVSSSTGTSPKKSTSSKKTKSTSTKSSTPGIVIREVVDMDTNKSYNRVTETGSIMEVNGPKRPKSKYWCYHKTRPIGSEVLLHIPGGGIVKLEVVAKLKMSNPHAIGLGKQLLEEVYGTRFAKKATFSYPQ